MPTTVSSYRQAPPGLVGGALCVDFVNTVSYRGDPQDCGERLTSFEELVVWATAAGAVDKKQAAAIAEHAQANERKAATVLADAISLRESLARLLLGKAPVSSADLAALNQVLRKAPRRTMLTRGSDGFTWEDAESVDPLHLIPAKIALSAADVLTSDQRERIRSCNDERCSWLFIDNSRTGERRWCDMKTCGNRAKARLHYKRIARQRKARAHRG